MEGTPQKLDGRPFGSKGRIGVVADERLRTFQSRLVADFKKSAFELVGLLELSLPSKGRKNFDCQSLAPSMNVSIDLVDDSKRIKRKESLVEM